MIIKLKNYIYIFILFMKVFNNTLQMYILYIKQTAELLNSIIRFIYSRYVHGPSLF